MSRLNFPITVKAAYGTPPTSTSLDVGIGIQTYQYKALPGSFSRFPETLTTVTIEGNDPIKHAERGLGNTFRFLDELMKNAAKDTVATIQSQVQPSSPPIPEGCHVTKVFTPGTLVIGHKAACDLLKQGTLIPQYIQILNNIAQENKLIVEEEYQITAGKRKGLADKKKRNVVWISTGTRTLCKDGKHRMIYTQPSTNEKRVKKFVTASDGTKRVKYVKF